MIKLLKRAVYKFRASQLKNLLRPVVIDDKLIRVGEVRDGAYIIPERILQQCEVCYSYGIGDNIDFDQAYHRITGKPAHLFDFTVEAPPNLPARGTFHKQGLSGVKNGHCDNYLEHLKANHDEAKKVLLKIDVEAAEYDWLAETDLAEVGKTALCIAMEFHWVQINRRKFIRLVKKLKAHYHIVHVHGNNFGGTVYGMPDVPEITFVHKQAATFGGPIRIKLPIASLDEPNNPELPDMVIDYSAG